MPGAKTIRARSGAGCQFRRKAVKVDHRHRMDAVAMTYRKLLALLALLCAGLLAWGGAQGFWFQPKGHDLPVAHIAGLPPEARQTLELIKKGGPFPYARDGIVFRNRENRLPAKPRDYYREYTVPTPGLRTRGARRIVTGQEGEYFYTPDHYRTFWRIKE